jgi:hypothetical protein
MLRRTLLAAFLTDRAIYGKKGIDIRFRLGLWNTLRRNGVMEHELKETLLTALPLRLGEWFPVLAGLLTIFGGIMFIVLATEGVRDSVLQIHHVFDGPLDLALLVIQWLAFYILISFISTLVSLTAAIAIYASRVYRHF